MSKTKVYLDMDGVLADFFTEYAKVAGIESGNYKEIPPAKTDPTLQKIVGTDFFARLPKTTSADQIVTMSMKLFGSYSICSSPLRGDHEGSEKWKKVWIQKHLNPPPFEIIITANKAKFAKQADGTPNILIDDREKNIASWENAGGIGIKYQADEDSLQVIVDGFSRAKKILNGDDQPLPKHKDTNTPGSASDLENENHEINDPMQRNAIMAKESVSAGATGVGSIASSPAQGGGWLFGGTVGAPKGKRKKSKIIKR